MAWPMDKSLWSESYRSQVDKKVVKESMSAVRVVADIFRRVSTIMLPIKHNHSPSTLDRFPRY